MGWGNRRLPAEGFPNVIIHTKVRHCYRPEVEGPVSLFVNLRGNSFCTVDRQTTLVDESHYFVSNRGQSYTLEIRDHGADTETFNIHFGQRFSDSVLNAVVTPAARLLEAGDDQRLPCLSFHNQLYRRDGAFDALVRDILTADDTESCHSLRFEEQMTSLLTYHLRQHHQVGQIIESLPLIRKATRVEVYKRLSRAMDVLRSGFCGQISLDELAAEACLSKYHFLRLFRIAFGFSPHQYIQHLRIEKARAMLAGTPVAVGDLATQLGFENSQSFSRLFYQRVGVYPSAFRHVVK